MIKHSEEFKAEAVRIALTSGLPRERVAADLGIGKSTLGKWLAQHRPTEMGVAANWLDGDFVAAAPNRKWAGDVTHIWTHEGWLYLAVILDLHSRRVVGWAVSDRMTRRAA